MKKLFKLILSLLLTLLLVGGVAFFMLTRLVDPSQFKGFLTDFISQSTGRPLKITGDLAWSFAEGLTLEANGIELENPKGFTEKSFARAQKISFRINPLPLLKGTVTVDKMTVKNLSLALRVNAQGKNNWQPVPEKKAPPKESNNKMLSSSRFTIQKIALKSIDIQNAKIAFLDQKNNRHLLISGFNLTGHLALKTPENSASTQRLPVDLLRALTLSLQFSAASINTKQVEATSLSGTLEAEDGIIKLAPLSAYFYGGKSEGIATLNVTGIKPELTLTELLTNVNAKSLFQALNYHNRLEGLLQANLTLTTPNLEALPQTLSGNATIEIKEGVIQGINVLHAINLAAAFLKGNLQSTLPQENKTTFSTMRSNLIIKKGAVRVNELQIDSDGFSLQGTGNADLINQTLSFAVITTLHEQATDPHIISLQKIMGGKIPFAITGTFSNYRIIPEYGEISKEAAKYLLIKNSDTIKKITDDLGNKASQQLKKLLNVPEQ